MILINNMGQNSTKKNWGMKFKRKKKKKEERKKKKGKKKGGKE